MIRDPRWGSPTVGLLAFSKKLLMLYKDLQASLYFYCTTFGHNNPLCFIMSPFDSYAQWRIQDFLEWVKISIQRGHSVRRFFIYKEMQLNNSQYLIRNDRNKLWCIELIEGQLKETRRLYWKMRKYQDQIHIKEGQCYKQLRIYD